MKGYSRFLSIYARAICFCLLTAMVAACSPDAREIVVDSFINPDIKTFSFDVDGSNTLTINIKSSADWTVKYDNDWLTELARTSSSLTIGAGPNDKQKVRSATIILKNEHGAETSVTVNQGFRLIPSANPYFFSVFNAEMVISSSGEYAAYIDFGYDANGWPYYTPVLINLNTGEVTVGDTKIDLQQEPAACCVTNDGGFIMQMPNNTSWNPRMKPVMFTADGTETAIDDGGYANVAVQGVSRDGKIMAGYIENGIDYIPCRWVDGRLETLAFPQESITGSTVHGVLTRGCSQDGSLIYGSEWNTELFSPVIWKNGKISYVGADMVKFIDYTSYFINTDGEEVLEDVSEYISPTLSSRGQLSPGGRYLASVFRGIYYLSEPDNIGYSTFFPMYFDLENNTHMVMENIPDGSGITVTDDGLFLYRDSKYIGYVYNIETGRVQTANEWMLNEYGLVVPGNSTIMSLSADKKTVLGYQVSYIGGMPFEMYWVALSRP